MEPIILRDILSAEDIDRIKKAISNEFDTREKKYARFPNKDMDIDDCVTYFYGSGRIDIRYPSIPQDIIDKVYNHVSSYVESPYDDLEFDFAIYAEYSKESGGNPKLSPHFDITQGSTIIFDYQLESNTDWGITVEDDTFILKDNSGLLFDPLGNIHSRPARLFNNEEFIRMIFFRFKCSKELVDHAPEDIQRLQDVLQKHNDQIKVAISNNKTASNGV